MLLDHGRQLHHLTAATEAIMERLQANPVANPTSTPPLLSTLSARFGEISASSQSAGLCLSLPDKSNGKPELCQPYLHQQAHQYPTKESKVSFLSDEVLEWLAKIWLGGFLPFHSYEAFT